MLSFLDVYINNNDPCNLFMSVYRKKTFTGLLTNFYSFTSHSYNIGLILTLVDRAYKINNTLAKFNDDVKNLLDIFKKNRYPESLISRVVHSYLESVQSSNDSKSATDTSTLYFKLPFLKLSKFTQRKISMLAKKYCKNLNIKLAFSSFKIKSLLTVKDRVHRSLRSCLVYDSYVRDVIPFILAKQLVIYIHECVSICTPIRTPIF